MGQGGPAPELTGSTPGSPSSPSAGPRRSAERTRRSQDWHESPWHGSRGQLRGCSGREGGGTEGHTLTFSPFTPWMPGSPWQGKAGAGRCSVSPSWSWGQPSPPCVTYPVPFGSRGAGCVLREQREHQECCGGPALPSTPITPGFTLTETPSLPGAPGSPRGPGLPGIPMAPSIPSGTVGHTWHGSPCPVGVVRFGGLRGDPRGVPGNHRSHPVTVTAPTLSPLGPRSPERPCGRKLGRGLLQGPPSSASSSPELA